MPNFEKIVPYLGNPLVLAGLVIFLTIGVLRLVLGLKIFSTVTAGATRAIILEIIRYAFILALVALVGGFALAAYRASLKLGPAEPEHKISSLVNPESVPVPKSPVMPPSLPAVSLTKRGEGTGVHGVTKTRIVPAPDGTPAPSTGTGRLVPHVSRILEGQSDSSQRRLFDITIENPSERQIMLDTFETSWQYYRGSLASVEHGEVIAPATEHAIKFKIDPADLSRRARSFPIQPTIVLPQASSAAPSVYVLRLELLYDFDKQSQEHPAQDWNLKFTVSIKTTDGSILPLFRDVNWR